MVAEEGQNTDAEHGRHKEKEQDVEFGMSVWQLVLGIEQTGEEERGINDKFKLRIFMEQKRNKRERERECKNKAE